MRRLAALLFALLAASLYAQSSLSVAVAPFANLSGQKDKDYLGFQAAEFISGALAGFPQVKVIERAAVDAILQEQELQLSGITDEKSAAEVGSLANAAQMVVGSYTVDGRGTMALTGRLVDVSTGSVLGSATLSGPIAPSPAALYRSFASKLLGSVSGYGVTVSVEARLDTLSSGDAAASADYARALEASFRKDDKAARKYLEGVVMAKGLPVSGYVDAAGRYNAVVSRLEGGNLYARLAQKVVSGNASLMGQLEPLSDYRNTLKALDRRLLALLSPQALEAKVVEEEDVSMGSVSAVFSLPKVSLALKPEVRSALEELFAGQDVVGLGSSGLELLRPAPSGSLLSDAALSGLFELSARAEAGYSIVFYGKKGEELWRLRARPAAFLVLDASSASFESDPRNPSFSAPAAKDGWELRPDGKVAVQARALKDLAGLRVEVDKEGYSARAGFGAESELRWKSLLLHAYRRSYAKLADPSDPCPAIKEIALADSFFETADKELGRVPLVPEGDERAAYARLTAVVYFGDESSGTVSAAWSGADSGNSVAFSGKLGPTSVLYFACPASSTKAGPETATVKIGTGPSRAATVKKSLGKAYKLPGYAEGFFADGGSVYITTNNDLVAWDLRARATKWSRGLGSYSRPQVQAVADGRIYYACDYWIGALDAASGKDSWKLPGAMNRSSRSLSLFPDGSRVFAGGPDGVALFDPLKDSLLWKYNGRNLLNLAAAGGQLFAAGRGGEAEGVVALDEATGAKLWESRESDARSLCLGQGLVFAAFGRSGFVAYEQRTGEPLWTLKDSGNSVLYADGRLFGIGSSYLRAIDPASGKELWHRQAAGWNLAYVGGVLYSYESHGGGDGRGANGEIHESIVAVDPDSGSVIWSADFPRYALGFAGELLLLNVDGKGWAYELSLINRD